MEHNINKKVKTALAGLLHLGLSPDDQAVLGSILMRQYHLHDGSYGLTEGGAVPCHPAFMHVETQERTLAPPCQTIGELRPIGMSNPLFDSPLWREQWKPGIEIHGYVAGCAGLAELAKPLGRAIVKFGTCDIGRLTERRRELGQQRYGSIYRSPSGYISEKGWAFWESFPRLQVGALSSFSPVRGSTESLIVTLPQGMTAGRAEALINRALLRYSLRYFADCDLGRKICAEQGILPDRLVRHSPGPNGSVTAATELLLLRPQADASRLAGIIADVIVGHVLGSVPDILKL